MGGTCASTVRQSPSDPAPRCWQSAQQYHGLAHLGRANLGEDVCAVPTVSLDEVTPGQRFGVVKIDVEGHEEAVLKEPAAYRGTQGA